MKEKFPCLNYLRLQPEAAAEVIYFAAIVHNVEIKLRQEFDLAGLLAPENGNYYLDFPNQITSNLFFNT